ncbi:hypothetical protein [Burkholderia sp. Bp9012]|uniref:hypothetical protein n=1 Tax=Burkholderia sp. Bp9012 TaxID=2184562 RepID=UPI000F5A5DFA|nr:hypothetical protein [Burkholderia sp. Bp9012]
MRIVTSRPVAWASTTLIGHMVMGLVIFTIPMTIVFSYLIAAEGNEPPGWETNIIGTGIVMGVVFGIMLWFGFTKKLVERAAKEKK